MANPVTTESIQLTDRVLVKLAAVRRLLRQYVLLHASVVVGFIVLFLFWLGGVIDFLPVTFGADETPRWLRLTLLVVMGCAVCWTLFVWAVPRLLARIGNSSIALMIERRNPALQNRLITAVELSEQSQAQRRVVDSVEWEQVSNPRAHSQMLSQVHADLEAQIEEIEVDGLFDWKPVWSGVICLTLAVLATLIAGVAMPDWFNIWSKRLFLLEDVNWPRQAALRAEGVEVTLPLFTGQFAAERLVLPFEDSAVQVPLGAAAVLRIGADTRKTMPEVCTMYYRTRQGIRGRANLRRLGAAQDRWQHFVLDGPPLDGLTGDLQLDVVGLDARLKGLELKALEPPVLLSTALRLEYPQYLLESLTRAAVEELPYRNGMRVPEGTRVTLKGQANSRLREVQFVVFQSAAQEEQTLSIESRSPEGQEFEIDLGRIKDGRIVELRLIDESGLPSSQVSRFVINAQPDLPPEVDSRLAGIGTAITRVAQLPLVGSATDDHGVRQTDVTLAKPDGQTLAVPLSLNADGGIETILDLKELQESSDFSLAAGDTLGAQVEARDSFDLGEGEHIGKGPPFQLFVVSQDDLLVLLDRQEFELRQRLELIISELQQLGPVLDAMAESPTSDQTAARVPSHVSPPLDWKTSLFGLLRVQVDEDEGSDGAERRKRMIVLRAQQSVLQGDKSEQELIGVVASVKNLREQLINNRIDSFYRQQRLQNQVELPLAALLQNEFGQLLAELNRLPAAAQADAVEVPARAAAASLTAILSELEKIKESMLDIETFNEIIDLVRGLLADQEELLEATQQTQREQILNLLQQ